VDRLVLVLLLLPVSVFLFFGTINLLLAIKFRPTLLAPIHSNPERVAILVPVKDDPSIFDSLPHLRAIDYPDYEVFWSTTQRIPRSAIVSSHPLEDAFESFAAPIAASNLAGFASGTAEGLLIVALLATPDLDAYNVALTVGTFLAVLLVRPLMATVLPASNRVASLGRDQGGVFAVADRYATLLVLPASVGIIVLARPLVLLVGGLGGPAYTATVLPVALSGVLSAQLQAEGKTGRVFLATALPTPVALGLGILLMPSLGLLGAALARVALYAIALLATWILARGNVPMRYDWGLLGRVCVALGRAPGVVRQRVTPAWIRAPRPRHLRLGPPRDGDDQRGRPAARAATAAATAGGWRPSCRTVRAAPDSRPDDHDFSTHPGEGRVRQPSRLRQVVLRDPHLGVSENARHFLTIPTLGIALHHTPRISRSSRVSVTVLACTSASICSSRSTTLPRLPSARSARPASAADA